MPEDPDHSVSWLQDGEEEGLIGRDRELEYMRERIDQTAEGGGQCILIKGEAGIGKTSLAKECAKYAENEVGFNILYGRCQDSKTPFLAWMEALKTIGLEHLIYQEPVKVEYASIIDNNGLHLAHVKTMETDLDDDLLNSMVTVVKDFLEDSFDKLGMGSKKKKHTLMEQGDYSILLVGGRHVGGMTISKGKTSDAIVEDLKAIIMDVNDVEEDTLKDWNGDLEMVSHLSTYIERLVKEKGGVRDPSRIVDERYLLFDNVSEELRYSAKDIPIMLILDDLQWSDSSTRELFHYVSRNTKDSPLLMLGIFRTEEVGEGLKDMLEKMSREGLRDDLELGRLSREHIKEMIHRRYEFALDSFVNAIFRKTEGNPYFVEEILRTLESEGNIDPANPRSLEDLDLDAIESISRNVDDVISRRLRMLPPDLYSALEWMSVTGNNVEYKLLYEVFKGKIEPKPLTQDEIQKMIDDDPKNAAQKISDAMDRPKVFTDSLMSDMLRDLSEAKLIREEETYKFDNALIQNTVYSRIPKDAKVTMHGYVGKIMERLYHSQLEGVIEKLAHHFIEARDAFKAFQYSLRAGEKASRMYSPDEALKHYTKIMKFRDEIPTIGRINILDKIMELSESVAWAKAIDYGEELIGLQDQVDDPLIMSRAYRVTGYLRTEKNSEVDLGLEYLERALELGEGAPEQNLRNLRVHGDILRHGGKYDKAFLVYQQAKAEADELGDELETAQVKVGMGALFFFKGDIGSAIDYFRDAISIFEKNKRFDVLSKAYNNLGVAYIHTKDHDMAIRAFEKSVEAGKKTNHEFAIAYSLSNLSDAYAQRFLEEGNDEDVKKCLDNADETRRVAERIGHKKLIAVSNGLHGLGYGLRGDMEKSEAHFTKALRSLKATKEADNYANMLVDRARVYKYNNDENTCLDDLKKARKMFHKMGQSAKVDELTKEIRELMGQEEPPPPED
jgi:predicted ATPase